MHQFSHFTKTTDKNLVISSFSDFKKVGKRYLYQLMHTLPI